MLDAAARMLGVDHDELSELALVRAAGAGGLVLVPYLEGERTPNRPDATGAVHGLRLETTTPAYLARAAVEGMLCGLADGLDAVRALGAPVERVAPGRRRRPVARGARDRPAVLGLPVTVPAAGGVRRPRRRPPGRLGARRRGRAAGSGRWPTSSRPSVEPTPGVRERYAAVRDLTAARP